MAKGCNAGKTGCDTTNAALDPQQVQEIRELLKSYKRGDDAKIAAKYDVCRRVICNIRRGVTYKVSEV